MTGNPMADLLRSALPPAQLEVGTVVADGNARAVNLRGAIIPARWGDHVLAGVGDAVLLARTDRTWTVIARLTSTVPTPQPRTGSVSSVSGSFVNVTVGATTYTTTWVGGTAPVAGQTVALLWQAGYDTPLVLGVSSTTPPTTGVTSQNPVVVPPAPTTVVTPTSGTVVFQAQQAWSWTGTTWADTAPLQQGTAQHGGTFAAAWWYGTAPQATLAGRTITHATLRLPVRVDTDTATRNAALSTHTQTTRGATPPALTSSGATIALPPATTPTVTILDITSATSLLNAITGGGGIGLGGTDPLTLPALTTDPSCGELTIDWKA